MKCLTTWAIALAMTVATAALGDDAKKELDKLQGAWKSEAYEIGGTKIEGESLRAVVATIAFKGDAFEWKAGDSANKGTVKIDATKKPIHIDFVYDAGEGVKITTWTGVYAVEGKTLKLCISPPVGERPKDFSTKSVRYGVFTFKQAK
jgi:uncharacterized protein (TIGR03067 family)